MNGKRKRFWALLLVMAMAGQQVSGVYAADMGQQETEMVGEQTIELPAPPPNFGIAGNTAGRRSIVGGRISRSVCD